MRAPTRRAIAIVTLSYACAGLAACEGRGPTADVEPMADVGQGIASGPMSFSGPTDYADGHGPFGPALGDWNGDGKLDLVMVNDEGSISLRLGNGDGTFGSESHILSSVGGSFGVATGDLDGDGKDDAVCVNYQYGGDLSSVTVYLSDGQTSVKSAPATYGGMGDGAYGIVLSDFNHDRKLDVATSARTDWAITVRLGNGDGTFGAPSKYPLVDCSLSYPDGCDDRSIAAGDLDGDGHIDLVTTKVWGVNVFRGNGDGTFQGAVAYSTGDWIDGYDTIAVALGDTDADGHLDIIVTNAITNNVGVLRGAAGGTFLPAATTPLQTGNNPYPDGVVAGDYDGDGKLDVAVVSGLTPHDVQILKGLGNGTFSPSLVLPIGLYPTYNAIASRDLNGDGKLDIVTTSRNSFTANVLLNTTPSCSDGVQNGNETSMDCGGSCTCHFLSDTPPAYESHVHACLGLNAAPWNPGGAIVIDGVTYAHGLAMEPPSYKEPPNPACPYFDPAVSTLPGHAASAWSLQRQYTLFRARLAISALECASSSVVYRVYEAGNPSPLYQSPLVTGAAAPIDIAVPIARVETLILDVDSVSGSSSCDHAVWADARVE